MKKLFTLLSALVVVVSVSFAINSPDVKPALRADQVFLTVGKSGNRISLQELSVISLKELQHITGKKMPLIYRIGFKMAQRKLRNSIDREGYITSKKMEKLFRLRDGDTGFHVGGFALGFFLNILGVLIAYLINDDYKRNRVKWAWIGLSVLISALLIISNSLFTF
ncbi:MAG: hypothetical protein ACT4OJ_00580 [Bacteroidota bacterium]